MYLAVGILRVKNGLDYSKILGDEAPKHILEAPKTTLTSNDSSAELDAKNSPLHGSFDSLSRNLSEGMNIFFQIFLIISKVHINRTYIYMC